jgi:hypothetical protein
MEVRILLPEIHQRPRGAARSARLVVSEEIRGSNPLGGASLKSARHGTVRQPAERPSSKLGDCGFDSHSCHPSSRRVGWALACPGALQVRLLPGALAWTAEHGPVVYWQGHHPLKVEMRVRLPSGLLSCLDRSPGGGMADARASEARAPRGVGVQVSPRRLISTHCGWAGARPSLINSERWVRHPDPQLSLVGWPGRQTGKAACLRGR